MEVPKLESAGPLRRLLMALQNALALRRETGASIPDLLRSALAMRSNEKLSSAQVIMSANAPILAWLRESIPPPGERSTWICRPGRFQITAKTRDFRYELALGPKAAPGRHRGLIVRLRIPSAGGAVTHVFLDAVVHLAAHHDYSGADDERPTAAAAIVTTRMKSRRDTSELSSVADAQGLSLVEPMGRLLGWGPLAAISRFQVNLPTRSPGLRAT